MPVEWSFDTPHGIARVRFSGVVEEAETQAMMRQVATVTTLLGHCSVVMATGEVTDAPGYDSVFRSAMLAVRLRNAAQPAHYVVLAKPGDAMFGKARQLVAIMDGLGISAEFFPDETAARPWMAEHNPRLAATP